MGNINSTINKIMTKLTQDTLVPGLDLVVDITIQKEDFEAYDTDTGDTTVTETTYALKGIIRDIKSQEVAAINSNRQALVDQNDKVVIISAKGQDIVLPSEITSKDRIIIATKEYSIITSNLKQLNNVDLAWILIVRLR